MSRATLILTQSEIERLVEMPAAIGVIAEAFKAQARGEVVMPPKVYLPLPHQSDFRAMPVYLAHPPACGIKWVNVHPGNRANGLPTVMGTVILNDPATGFPRAILDGLSITRLRTGAAAGVAAKALARRDSRLVGLVGCGAQALAQLTALEAVLPIRQVKVWGYRPHEAQQFCAAARRQIAAALMPVASVRACVEAADVIVTITTSRRPLVRCEWVKPGAHVNAIGADAPGKQELDPRILRQARLIVDDRTQALHGGEINVSIARGFLKPSDIRGTLGEVLLGRLRGRTRADEITVFDSTGIAVHDVALADAIVRLSRRRRLGRAVCFFR